MAEAEAGTGGAEAELSLFFLTAEQAVAEEAEDATVEEVAATEKDGEAGEGQDGGHDGGKGGEGGEGGGGGDRAPSPMLVMSPTRWAVMREPTLRWSGSTNPDSGRRSSFTPSESG